MIKYFAVLIVLLSAPVASAEDPPIIEVNPPNLDNAPFRVGAGLDAGFIKPAPDFPFRRKPYSSLSIAYRHKSASPAAAVSSSATSLSSMAIAVATASTERSLWAAVTSSPQAPASFRPSAASAPDTKTTAR